MTLRTLCISQPQKRTEQQGGKGNHRHRAALLLDHILEQITTDHRWQRRPNQQQAKPQVLIHLPGLDAVQRAERHARKVLTVVQHHRQQRANMHSDVEFQTLILPAE